MATEAAADDRQVLAACSLAAQHAVMLSHAAPAVERLVGAGLLRRFALPPATKARWLQITPAGIDRLAELRGEARRGG